MVNFFNYDKYVVVAEKEWKLDFEPGSGSRTITFPVTIEYIDWQIRSSVSGNSVNISLSCTSVALRHVDQVHAEIHGYSRVGDALKYDGPGLIRYNKKDDYYYEPTPLRHVFKQNDNSIRFNATMGSDKYASILFIVRVLKDRDLLPNFKSEDVQIDNWVSDVKLRVADQQIFHGNKELLSAHSKVFDRMFNSEFKEANQEVVELQHEPADPALFEDFLLVLLQYALPNRINLSLFFKLADYYDAEGVREACKSHFWMCLEMPVVERYMLALEFGNEVMQDSTMNSVDSIADMKRIVAAMKERMEFKK